MYPAQCRARRCAPKSILSWLFAAQAFAARMCSLADQAAPLLVDALAAGGEEAGVAAYCLTSRVCANSSDAHAAYGALLDSPEIHDPAQVLG